MNLNDHTAASIGGWSLTCLVVACYLAVRAWRRST